MWRIFMSYTAHEHILLVVLTIVFALLNVIIPIITEHPLGLTKTVRQTATLNIPQQCSVKRVYAEAILKITLIRVCVI